MFEYRIPKDELFRYDLSEDAKDRINMVAVKRFNRDGKRVHIHTHYDVVPPSSGLSKDPFKSVIENEKLYGRGASDMKSVIAASIYAIEIVEELSGKNLS